MDAVGARVLADLLAGTAWVERTRSFARTMRRRTDAPGGLLLVGPPDAEPWHLTAHLDEEAQAAGIAELAPTLVKWVPDPTAAHLSVGMSRLAATRRGETVVVVAEQAAPEGLLERVADARRHGATVLAMDGGDPDLEDLAHESIVVASGPLDEELVVVHDDLVVPPVSLDTVQHLVSVAAGDVAAAGRRGMRDRLAQLLDTVSGPAPTRGR